MVILMENYDVIICGGGTAGCAAALAAARGGLSVMLCEQNGELGGIVTTGCVGYIMDADKKGIVEEIKNSRCAVSNGKNFMVNPEYFKYYLERRLLEAGVRIKYFSKAIGVKKNGDNIESVVVAQKSEIREYCAKAYVDATGDGDLAYFAGCSYEVGKDGVTQPSSFDVIVAGINYEEVKDCVFNAPDIWCEDAKANLLAEFKRAGFTPSYIKPTLGITEKNLFVYAINHQYVSPLTEEELTMATIEGRKEVFESLEALRSLGGRWKNIIVAKTPGYIGVREGRRIKGVKTITAEDLINGTKCENSMCRVSFNVDIHCEDGYDNAGIKTQPYDIPVEAMTSAEVKNLFMAGRCISGDFYAHASYRVCGNTLTMGENLGRYLACKL